MLKVLINSTTHRVRISSIGPRGIQGEVGPSGEQGEQGIAGQGVPVGGSVGQYLAKDSSTDFDTSWQDFPDTAWGDLIGDITDQIDLMALLSGKQDTIAPGTTLQFYRGDKTFQTINTAIVPESGNLYYTQARFDTAFAAKDTDDLAEGANLYYRQDRFDAAFAAKTTANLTEGSNLYYTNDRVDARIALQKAAANGLATLDGSTKIPAAQLPTLTTTDIAEGSRLYFTDERVDDRVALLIQNGTGITWTYNDALGSLTPAVSLATFSTTNLSEGSNQYFTDERAQDAVGTILTDTASIDFTYNDALNTISAVVLPAGVDHNSLANLATGDVHTQYPLLLGRSGGQTLIGGTASGNSLTLQSTSNATKGKILFGTSAYDEVNNRLGVGNAAPTVPLDVTGSALISGNVGIGVSPSNKLSVSGNADVVGNLGLGTTGPHSKLDVRGGVAFPITNKTGTYAILSSDHTVTCDATSGAFSATLPTAVGISGRRYTIKKIDASANAITVATTSSQTIDGSTTYSLPTQWKYVTVQSNGANWIVVANN